MSDLPRLELKQDQKLGRFILVPDDEAEEVAEYLHECGIGFQRDPECAARLAHPGCAMFLFGMANIATVRDALLNCGYPVQVDPLVTMTEDSYRPPLDQLLRLGRPKGYDFTMDYAARGITSGHVPELLRMLADEELHTAVGDSLTVWAPLHAWRALAELKAEEAIGPLLDLLRRIDDEDDDWVNEDVPKALGELGRASIDPVAAYLADAHHKEWARVAAAKALAEIGKRHPELQPDCTGRLAAQLERFADQPETFNAFLVSPLLDLKARETMPVIERAYTAGKVDESVVGDLEDVEIELGFKTARARPRKPNRLTELGAKLQAIAGAEEKMDASLTEPPRPFVRDMKIGRNDPCPCGSGKKYKKCCGKS